MDRMILASTSPRRKALLDLAGYTYEIITKDIDEEKYISLRDIPEVAVSKISKAKGEEVFNEVEGDIIVISADTVVCYDNIIIGKPKSEEDGYNTLKKLQGNMNYVYTCVTIFTRKAGIENIHQILDSTKVYMGKMEDKEIKDYIETKEPLDKAGSYGIQGIGALYIEKIEGDFYNVEGLPIRKVYLKLKELGIYPKRN